MVLSPQGNQAVLFTNASSVERLTVVDLGIAPVVRSFNLQKSIRSLGYDPTATSLIVTHAKTFGNAQENGISFEEFIDRSFGYSIVDIATGFDKLQITAADPGAFQFSTTTPRAYVLVDGGDGPGAVAQTHVIELDTGVVRLQTMSFSSRKPWASCLKPAWPLSTSATLWAESRLSMSLATRCEPSQALT